MSLSRSSSEESSTVINATVGRYIYCDEHRIIICSICQVGLHLGNIKFHSNKAHGDSELTVRGTATKIRQWQPTPHASEDSVLTAFSALRYPIPYIPQLKLYEGCVRCSFTGCDFLSRSDTAMRSHQQAKHPGLWTPSVRGGTARKRIEDKAQQPWTGGLICQRLLKRGKLGNLFEVETPPAVAITTDSMPLDTMERLMQEGNDAIQARLDQVRSRVQLLDDYSTDNWLRFTRWPRFLGHCLIEDLLWFGSEPNADDEPATFTILEALLEIAEKAHALIKYRATDSALKEAIRSDHPQSGYDRLQAYLGTEVKTAFRPWRQLLLIIIRATQPEKARNIQDGPIINLGSQQRQAFSSMMNEAQRHISQAATTDTGPEPEPEVDSGMNLNTTSRTSIHIPGSSIEVGHPRLGPLPDAVLQFVMSLMTQLAEPDSFSCALVQAIAIYAVRPDGEFARPSQIDSPLSHVIKFARMWIVWWVYDEAIAARASDVGERTRVMVENIMLRSSKSPMSYIVDIRGYGMGIERTTARDGDMQITESGLIIRGSVQFTMVQFRSMIQNIIAVALNLLQTTLVDSTAELRLPKIPWTDLHDNLLSQQPGYTFIRDPRSRFPVDGRTWLSQRINSDPYLRARWISGSHWNQEHIRSWCRSVQRFRELLLVLMHITGGQPARGPELLTVQYANGPRATLRSIFLEGDMVSFVTEYHKGYHHSRELKIIHRYLPRAVGELLIYHLWLIVPMYQIFLNHGHGDWDSGLLWPRREGRDRNWTSERISTILHELTSEHLNHSFGLATYRHLAIGISRTMLQPHQQFQEDSDRDADWLASPLSQAIDYQAAHTPYTAQLVYARDLFAPAGWRTAQRQAYRRVSVAWHNLLGVRSTSSHRTTELPSASVVRHRHQRLKELVSQNLLQCLRYMLQDDHLNFKPLQQEVIRDITRGRSPILAVMPTGGGKSMLFMLPAWMSSDGVTIVIVPLLSLRGDLARRCRQVGLSCVEWRPENQSESAQIVLTTPETAIRDDFSAYVTRLRLQGRLDRVFVDECHEVLQDHSSFRKSYDKLHTLLFHQTQLVFCTGTLPPTSLSRFLDALNLNQEQIIQHRITTSRPNISYRLTFHHPSEIINEVVKLATAHIRRQEGSTSPEKLIVYVATRDEVDNLSQILGCGGYHAKKDDRQTILDDFRDNFPVPAIVATNALGLGIDIPDISSVVHVGFQHNLLNYAQESGRAGRDGRPSTASILCPDDWMTSVAFRRLSQEEQMSCRRFMKAGRCRRGFLGNYLDGSALERTCSSHELPCAFCEPDPALVVSDPPVAAQTTTFPSMTDQFDEILMQFTLDPPPPTTSTSISRHVPPRPPPPVPASLPIQQSRASSVTSSTPVPLLSRNMPPPPPPPVTTRISMQLSRAPSPTSPPSVELLALEAEERRRSMTANSALSNSTSVLHTMGSIRVAVANWSARCPICHGSHRMGVCRSDLVDSATLHTIWQCRDQLRRLAPEPYRQCNGCRLPQPLCNTWQLISNVSDSYKRISRDCEFKDVICECVAVWFTRERKAGGRGTNRRVRESLGSASDIDPSSNYYQWYKGTVKLRSGERVTRLITEFVSLSTDLTCTALPSSDLPLIPSSAAHSHNSNIVSVSISLDQIREQLQKWKQCCPACRRSHRLGSCPGQGDRPYRVVRDALRGCKPENYRQCTGCRCPQPLCNTWIANPQQPTGFRHDKNATCQYKDIVCECLSVWQSAAIKQGSELQRRMTEAGCRVHRLDTASLVGSWYNQTVMLSSGQLVARLITEFVEQDPHRQSTNSVGRPTSSAATAHRTASISSTSSSTSSFPTTQSLSSSRKRSANEELQPQSQYKRPSHSRSLPWSR